jgi:predicted amidohydrolase
MLRVGLIQLCAGRDPQANLQATEALVRQAAGEGARFVLTPEVTNCVTSDRAHQAAVLHPQETDPTLACLRQLAAELGIWLLIGSLGIKTTDADGRYANRSFMIGPDGALRAHYDKIHMFDVQVSASETYRESASYRPGNRAVLCQTDFAAVGMTICYDLRFAHLHRALAQAGAQILTVPAAFSPVTGAAHWQVLLQARAIETGCFVLAPAQTGLNDTHNGAQRRTYGHSMVVAPWGEVLLDAGTAPGAYCIDLDLAQVEQARLRVPALGHDRSFDGPDHV